MIIRKVDLVKGGNFSFIKIKKNTCNLFIDIDDGEEPLDIDLTKEDVEDMIKVLQEVLTDIEN